MTRPRLCRKICFPHQGYFYKPQGVPLRSLKVLSLSEEEAEALRLKDIEGLDQIKCAEKMKTSQSTFQRILTVARRKSSEAIIGGLGLRIEKN